MRAPTSESADSELEALLKRYSVFQSELRDRITAWKPDWVPELSYSAYLFLVRSATACFLAS